MGGWVLGLGFGVGILEVVDEVAGRQDGVVTLEQARRAGLSVQEVQRLCRRGRWRRLSRCTYLVRGEVPDAVLRRARIRAAVTSLGPEAVAVLGTAAEVHGLAGLRRSEEIHVSLPGGAARPRRPHDAALVVHQLVVDPRETVHVRGRRSRRRCVRSPTTCCGSVGTKA
jgi:hypothetical protein